MHFNNRNYGRGQERRDWDERQRDQWAGKARDKGFKGGARSGGPGKGPGHAPRGPVKGEKGHKGEKGEKGEKMSLLSDYVCDAVRRGGAVPQEAGNTLLLRNARSQYV